MTAPLFTLSHVSLPGRPGRPRLDDVSLTIPPGVTAVVGASGAGKSSLLEVLVGFEAPSSGMIKRGAPPSGDGEAGGLFWVPSDLGLWPGETVMGHLLAVQPERDEAAAEALLDRFGLAGVADRRPGTLSAGERSRLALARAVASGAGVLVLDEPLAHVDPAALPGLWAVLREHWDGTADGVRRSVVFAIHDPAAALRESTHCVALADGRVRFAGPTTELHENPPDRATGALLGPLNELPDGPRRFVRAERLELAPQADGPLTVVRTAPAGPVTTTELTDPAGTRTVLHHRPGPPLPVGARVATRLAFALLAAVLLGVAAGCDGGGADGPALRFAEVRVRATPNAGPQLPAPRGVGIGPGNEAYVLDDAGRVLVFSPEGEELRRWDMPSNVQGNPEGICVYRPPGVDEWLVAVADTHYHRVVLFTTAGEVVTEWGVEGDEPGNFRFPVAVTADDAGRLYVGEYGGNDRVQVFSPHPENAPLRSIGSFGTGPGQFSRASGVAWVPPASAGGDGESGDAFVLVADAFGDRIQRFTTEGDYRGVLGGDDAVSLHSPYDLARAADGTLWIPEYHGGRITALRADGTLLGRWSGDADSSDGRTGPLVTPWGLDVDRTGRVWIADTGNRRLVTLVP
ncbi:ATP-binding cassette domain-containing protein [Alienimonas californiensis]|uniref:Sulfate/thiosulfate import ATP-binding protein CysA n=1 Tax=Alienimonas californiensis TaxID=2527989 RepID=A0A517PC17_9PLAN|nr:ATP-binding cassette domain-containing protein [Alienimonas californiensis]QDT16920.1 Sulfate/thiosulfate import ATP-binding protein CysA [Alienimonas californiensis]